MIHISIYFLQLLFFSHFSTGDNQISSSLYFLHQSLFKGRQNCVSKNLDALLAPPSPYLLSLDNQLCAPQYCMTFGIGLNWVFNDTLRVCFFFAFLANFKCQFSPVGSWSDFHPLALDISWSLPKVPVAGRWLVFPNAVFLNWWVAARWWIAGLFWVVDLWAVSLHYFKTYISIEKMSDIYVAGHTIQSFQ